MDRKEAATYAYCELYGSGISFDLDKALANGNLPLLQPLNKSVVGWVMLEEVPLFDGDTENFKYLTVGKERDTDISEMSHHYLGFDSITDLVVEKPKGKKGDRVYVAPKAFWNKSK